MKHIVANLRLLEQDILSGRISFKAGITHVPTEERNRFLLRLNRLISEEHLKALLPDRLAALEALDELVSADIEALNKIRDAKILQNEHYSWAYGPNI